MSYGSILTTKLYAWNYREPFQYDKPQMASAKLIFNESRILTEEEWGNFQTAFLDLERAAPTNYPPGLHKFFSKMDGLSFFLELSGLGEYRLIQNYLRVLQWFARATNLGLLQPYKQAPDLEQQAPADAAPVDVFDKYVVRKGDTLFSIARKFKDRDTREEIVKRNGIRNAGRIIVGQTLEIQQGQKTDKDK